MVDEIFEFWHKKKVKTKDKWKRKKEEKEEGCSFDIGVGRWLVVGRLVIMKIIKEEAKKGKREKWKQIKVT